ncbi:hypothetical protein ACFPMF_02100 [Larkinella bovis]|uniref:Uncharacterized protein n=1 Tax=Larkinella bovis TaxID=683041 RepID=A0ABW0I3J3_9BACT
MGPPVELRYGFSARVVRRVQPDAMKRRERWAYRVVGGCMRLLPLGALIWQAVFRVEDWPCLSCCCSSWFNGPTGGL